MKYHINFGDDYKLSFQMLDNPIADAWINIMQGTAKDNQIDQIVRRSVVSSAYLPIVYFNELKYYYGVLKEEYNLDLEFDLPKKEVYNFSDSDYTFIDNSVNYIFNKVVKNNFYYNTTDKELLSKWSLFLHHLRENKEKLIDCYYNKETYVRISNKKEEGNKIRITDNMRKTYWVENERPNIVLRLDCNFDEKTLDLAEKRNLLDIVESGKLTQMDYISSSYKVCYYENSLTDSQAVNFMRTRRDAMSNFVESNSLDVQFGDYRHYYFINPVIGHCLDKNVTKEEIYEMFTKYNSITSEFGE